MRRFKCLGAAMAIGLTIAIALRPDVWANIEKTFSAFDWKVIIALLSLFLLMRLFQAYSLRVALNSANHVMPVTSAFGLVALKGFFNLAFVGAGLFAQAVRAKSSLNVGFSAFAYASVYQAIVLFSVLGLLTGVVGCIVLQTNEQKATFGVAGFVAAATPFMLIAVMHRLPTVKNTILGQMVSRLSQYRFGHWRSLISLALLGGLFFLSRLIRISLIALTAEEEIQFGVFWLTVIVADLSTVIPLTPGGIGVRELVIGAGGNWVGQLDIFLAAAILDRVIGLVFSLLHGLSVIFLYQLSSRYRGR